MCQRSKGRTGPRECVCVCEKVSWPLSPYLYLYLYLILYLHLTDFVSDCLSLSFLRSSLPMPVPFIFSFWPFLTLQMRMIVSF